jgi:hypothetical protein
VVHGDPNVRHHVHGLGGSLLLAVVVLGAAGIVAAARRRRHDPWWRFVAYGLLVSPVPGTLTIDRMHSLRMVAFPIFLLLFAALALARLLAEPARWGRPAVGLVVAAALVQGGLFQAQFRRKGPDRGPPFEAAYPQVLDRALARGGPVYVLDDDHTYADGLWYAVLKHRRRDVLRIARAPAGGTVVGAVDPCAGCTVVVRDGRLVAYVSR